MADRLEGQILELRESMERQERFIGSFAHEARCREIYIFGKIHLRCQNVMSAISSGKGVRHSNPEEVTR